MNLLSAGLIPWLAAYSPIYGNTGGVGCSISPFLGVLWVLLLLESLQIHYATYKIASRLSVREV
jgi:hypothetical protein